MAQMIAKTKMNTNTFLPRFGFTVAQFLEVPKPYTLNPSWNNLFHIWNNHFHINRTP